MGAHTCACMWFQQPMVHVFLCVHVLCARVCIHVCDLGVCVCQCVVSDPMDSAGDVFSPTVYLSTVIVVIVLSEMVHILCKQTI